MSNILCYVFDYFKNLITYCYTWYVRRLCVTSSDLENCILIYRNILLCSVDSTQETGRLGRLVNHWSKNPNCKIRLVSLSEKHAFPAIFAARPIATGEEIVFNYCVSVPFKVRTCFYYEKANSVKFLVIVI